MYLDLVFIYVRDLALAHARPDPNFCVSPCTVPDAGKGTTFTWSLLNLVDATAFLL